MLQEMLHELFKAKTDFVLYYYSPIFSLSALYVKVLVEKCLLFPAQ